MDMQAATHATKALFSVITIVLPLTRVILALTPHFWLLYQS